MKKTVIIILIIIAVSALGAGVYIKQKSQNAAVISPDANAGQAPSPVPIELALWEDQAGFTFQYPKDVSINKHDEDDENYAHIELTQKDHPGSIIIWAKDTTAADAAGWVKAEKSLTGGTVFDTTLGDISGKKVLVTTPKKVVTSGVVDEGILFYVEGIYADSQYWTRAYDAITSSFAFSEELQDAVPAGGSQDTESVDEEEIIE